MAFVGNINEKISVVATIKGVYDNGGYIPGRENWHHSYLPTTYSSWAYYLEDADGNTIIWKSSNLQMLNDSTPYKKNDVVLVKGTVKGNKVSAKGVDQTVITRAKFEIVSVGMTEEEEVDMKRAEQLKGRAVKEVSYREYKEKYSDCETLYKSFYRDPYGYSFITIIIG